MTNRLTYLAVLAVAASGLTTSGCSLLAPRADPSRFFTLIPLAQAQQDETSRGASARTGVTYGLGPIKLPAYLDRNEVATRVSPTELIYSVTDRWAEPLKDNVRRVLVQNLSALLDTDRIVGYPWWNDLAIDYQVEIEFLHFECAAAGASQLAARWGIKDGRNDRYMIMKESRFTRPGQAGATNESVDALSGTLGDLSQEIASALRALPTPQEAPPSARERS